MIRSTFAGFNTAQLAMSASQRALDVTGQNLSNINTTGYTRQRLDLASISPVGASIGSSAYDSKVGQGVMMTGVSQIRDPFLDIQYRNQLPKVGTADAMDSVLSQIGNVFDETDRAAVREQLNNLLSQLTNMATDANAGTSSADMLVRSACEVLLDTFHQNASSIKNVQDELVGKLEQSVMPDIASYMEEIVNLNKSIKSSQILGNPALELQDQRNDMLDALATYFPIEVKYNTVNLGSGIKVDTLEVNLKTKDGGKISLISDTEMGSVTMKKTDGTDVPITLTVKDAKTGADTDITDALANGVLKGNADMLNKSGEFDGSDTKGIGYYMKTFDMFVNKFATMLNEMNGADKPLFETDVKSPDGTDYFTASSIKISKEWMNGTVTVTTSTGADAGSSAYDNVLKMINALSVDKQKFESGNVTYTGTFYDCYDGIQNTQAIERKAAASILDNHTTVLQQIANSKDSVSGVYMDEEVMNLMRYQQSYNAAARLMTTLDELLDRLITGTGVVGR